MSSTSDSSHDVREDWLPLALSCCTMLAGFVLNSTLLCWVSSRLLSHHKLPHSLLMLMPVCACVSLCCLATTVFVTLSLITNTQYPSGWFCVNVQAVFQCAKNQLVVCGTAYIALVRLLTVVHGKQWSKHTMLYGSCVVCACCFLVPVLWVCIGITAPYSERGAWCGLSDRYLGYCTALSMASCVFVMFAARAISRRALEQLEPSYNFSITHRYLSPLIQANNMFEVSNALASLMHFIALLHSVWAVLESMYMTTSDGAKHTILYRQFILETLHVSYPSVCLLFLPKILARTSTQLALPGHTVSNDMSHEPVAAHHRFNSYTTQQAMSKYAVKPGAARAPKHTHALSASLQGGFAASPLHLPSPSGMAAPSSPSSHSLPVSRAASTRHPFPGACFSPTQSSSQKAPVSSVSGKSNTSHSKTSSTSNGRNAASLSGNSNSNGITCSHGATCSSARSDDNVTPIVGCGGILYYSPAIMRDSNMNMVTSNVTSPISEIAKNPLSSTPIGCAPVTNDSLGNQQTDRINMMLKKAEGQDVLCNPATVHRLALLAAAAACSSTTRRFTSSNPATNSSNLTMTNSPTNQQSSPCISSDSSSNSNPHAQAPVPKPDIQTPKSVCPSSSSPPAQPSLPPLPPLSSIPRTSPILISSSSSRTLPIGWPNSTTENASPNSTSILVTRSPVLRPIRRAPSPQLRFHNNITSAPHSPANGLSPRSACQTLPTSGSRACSSVGQKSSPGTLSMRSSPDSVARVCDSEGGCVTVANMPLAPSSSNEKRAHTHSGSWSGASGAVNVRSVSSVCSDIGDIDCIQREEDKERERDKGGSRSRGTAREGKARVKGHSTTSSTANSPPTPSSRSASKSTPCACVCAPVPILLQTDSKSISSNMSPKQQVTSPSDVADIKCCDGIDPVPLSTRSLICTSQSASASRERSSGHESLISPAHCQHTRAQSRSPPQMV